MSNVNTSVQEALTVLKNAREQARKGGDNGGGGDHTGGHEPPGGNGVEARVAKLESDVEYIKRDVGEIAHSIKVIQGDVGVLKTQSAVLIERTDTIKSDMVTKAQLAMYAAGTLVAIVAGTWWIVQQYLAPILVGLSKLPTT
ncbi:hypothetical protein [Pseudomonas sp. F(2018)]|uniref:hypothetical protein n=1 Tax=Pseudomonas sp. F(2018) TaxID=2502240 RepID=UPI0015A7ACC1|nr:hypothetical protein [Pseudomonas sp. F(2018)]